MDRNGQKASLIADSGQLFWYSLQKFKSRESCWVIFVKKKTKNILKSFFFFFKKTLFLCLTLLVGTQETWLLEASRWQEQCYAGSIQGLVHFRTDHPTRWPVTSHGGSDFEIIHLLAQCCVSEWPKLSTQECPAQCNSATRWRHTQIYFFI